MPIDRNHATIGNPEIDSAEYILMIRYSVLPPYLPSEFNVRLNEIREPILKTFIEEYTRLSDIEDIEAWIIPIAKCRLASMRRAKKKVGCWPRRTGGDVNPAKPHTASALAERARF